MDFVLLILITNIGFALESVCYKYFQRNKAVTTMLAVSVLTFLGYLVAGLITFFISGPQRLFVNINIFTVFITLIGAVISVFQMILWISALKHIKMSVAETTTNFQLIVMAFFSFIFFNETLTVVEIILLLLVLVFCFLLGSEQAKKSKSLQKSCEKGQKKPLKGLVFIVVWVILSSVKNVLNKKLLIDEMHPVSHQIIFYGLLIIIVLGIFIFNLKNKERGFAKREFKDVIKNKWFFVVPFANIVGGICFLTLIKNYNLGLIQALMGLSSVILIFYERAVFKEKISALSYFYMAAIILFSAILSLIAG